MKKSPRRLKELHQKNTPQSNKARDQTETKPKEEIGYVEALKLVMENNQRTVELLLKASKDRGASEAVKLDQEDQRIKVM